DVCSSDLTILHLWMRLDCIEFNREFTLSLCQGPNDSNPYPSATTVPATEIKASLSFVAASIRRPDREDERFYGHLSRPAASIRSGRAAPANGNGRFVQYVLAHEQKSPVSSVGDCWAFCGARGTTGLIWLV